jgi:hypothetical protein
MGFGQKHSAGDATGNLVLGGFKLIEKIVDRGQATDRYHLKADTPQLFGVGHKSVIGFASSQISG